MSIGRSDSLSGADEGVGGVHGRMFGSGKILMGMPRLTKVAGDGIEAGCDAVFNVCWQRSEGKDEEMTGLSVRRLWIRGFCSLRVPTPKLCDSCIELLPELAASCGVVMIAEDEGGRIAKVSLRRSKFRMWDAILVESIGIVVALRSMGVVKAKSFSLELELGLITAKGLELILAVKEGTIPGSIFPIDRCKLHLIPSYSCSRLMKTWEPWSVSPDGIPPRESSRITRSREISLWRTCTSWVSLCGSSGIRDRACGPANFRVNASTTSLASTGTNVCVPDMKPIGTMTGISPRCKGANMRFWCVIRSWPRFPNFFVFCSWIDDTPMTLSRSLAPWPLYRSMAVTTRSPCSSARWQASTELLIAPPSASITTTQIKPSRVSWDNVCPTPCKIASVIEWGALIFTRATCSESVPWSKNWLWGAWVNTGLSSTALSGRWRLPIFKPNCFSSGPFGCLIPSFEGLNRER